MNEFEVFLMIDENGDYVVCKERSELDELYCNDIGDAEAAKRIIAITIKAPLPAAVVVTVEVPAEPTNATVAVA